MSGHVSPNRFPAHAIGVTRALRTHKELRQRIVEQIAKAFDVPLVHSTVLHQPTADAIYKQWRDQAHFCMDRQGQLQQWADGKWEPLGNADSIGVEVVSEDSDAFKCNVYTIRAEMQVAMQVVDPGVLGIITGGL